jgi:hypothetical protein
MTKTQVVLSAKALGISQTEHSAALEVRELFVSGKLHHDKDIENLAPNGFNMNAMVSKGECGTTCCIGGWMFLVMVRDRTNPCSRSFDYVQKYRSPALAPLFYPFTDIHRRDLLDQQGHSYDFPFEDMPPEFGLAALDNFLTTADPNWPGVAGLLEIEGTDQS